MPKNHHGCSTSGGKDPSDGEQTPEENQASAVNQNVTATINPFAPLPRNRQPERSGDASPTARRDASSPRMVPGTWEGTSIMREELASAVNEALFELLSRAEAPQDVAEAMGNERKDKTPPKIAELQAFLVSEARYLQEIRK